MRKRLETLTPRDIKNYKRDIEALENRKKLFLILGFVFLALFIACLVGSILLGIAIYNELGKDEFGHIYFLFAIFDTFAITFTVLFAVGFIAMFVLRVVLIGKQIDKRKRIVEDYEDLHHESEVDETKTEWLKRHGDQHHAFLVESFLLKRNIKNTK